MSKLFNRSTKAVLPILLTLTLILSLFCVSALAADMPNYPHLEVGTAAGTSFKAGDTVKIPVSLTGLKEEQYLSGFSCNVDAMNDGYLTIKGVEFSATTDSWSGGYNTDHKSVNKVNLTFAERPEDSLHSDGLLFTVVCEVVKDIPAGTSTGIRLSNVSMSQTSTLFLNSTDGTQNGLDSNAVVYPVDGNGNHTGGISVPEKTVFVMSISANKASVEMDEIVTVTITGNGGTFNGVDYQMTYDPALFELVTKPGDAEQTNNTFRHATVFSESKAGGDTIGTYTFKALAQDAEVVGEFALVDGACYIESYASSIEGNSEPCNISAPATVKITLKDDLTVSADDVTVDFDNQPHSVTATANKDGADIKYADSDGEYTLNESPEYTAIGEYTVKFRATLKGYETAYGEAKITINQPKYVVESNEYVSGYSLVLVYTNYDVIRYTYDGNVMMNVSDAGYKAENGETYEYVYGWVVKGNADTSKIGYTASTAEKVKYSNDVNGSGKVDMRDVVATSGIYNTYETYMADTTLMATILLADVDHDKAVDVDDYSVVLAEYINKQ